MRRTGPRWPQPLRCLHRVGHTVDRTQMVFMFSENIPGSPGYGGRGNSACRSLALFHGGRGPETVSDGRELCPWAWHARGQGAAGTQGVTREAGGSQRCAGSRRDPGTPTERGRHWLDPLRPRAPRLGSLRRSKSPSVGRRVRFTPVLLTTRPLWPDARRPLPGARPLHQTHAERSRRNCPPSDQQPGGTFPHRDRGAARCPPRRGHRGGRQSGSQCPRPPPSWGPERR